MIRFVASLLLVCAAATPALAQVENSTAFSVERFMPAPGQGGLLGTEEADVLPHGGWTVGAFASLLSRPIALERIGTRDEVLVPVDTRLGVELSGAIGVGNRYQVGLALPLVLGQSGDRLKGIGFSEDDLDAFAAGDVRVHAKVRMAGEPGTPGVRAGVATSISFPTGNQHHFAGEAGEVFTVGLVGGYRAAQWRVGANLLARFRTREVVLFTPSRPHGNELVASLGAAVTFAPVDLLAEYTQVVGDCEDKLAGGGCAIEGHSPAEVRLGARIAIDAQWSAMLAFGLGTTPDEVGSPAWRAILGATWTPKLPKL